MIGIMISIKPDEYCKILNNKQKVIITTDANFAVIVKKLINKQGHVFIAGCCRNDKKIRLYKYIRRGIYFIDSFKNDFWYTDNKSINGLIPAYLTINDIQMPHYRKFHDIAKQLCLSPEELAVKVRGKPYFVMHINKVNNFPIPLQTRKFTTPMGKCERCKYKEFYGSCHYNCLKYIMNIPKNFRYIQVDWDVGKFIDN